MHTFTILSSNPGGSRRSEDICQEQQQAEQCGDLSGLSGWQGLLHCGSKKPKRFCPTYSLPQCHRWDSTFMYYSVSRYLVFLNDCIWSNISICHGMHMWLLIWPTGNNINVAGQDHDLRTSKPFHCILGYWLPQEKLLLPCCLVSLYMKSSVSWISPQTVLTHLHPILLCPSCPLSPWSCPGQVPATTEAQLCWVTLWRSGKTALTSQRAGLN